MFLEAQLAFRLLEEGQSVAHGQKSPVLENLQQWLRKFAAYQTKAAFREEHGLPVLFSQGSAIFLTPSLMDHWGCRGSKCQQVLQPRYSAQLMRLDLN